MGGLVLRQAPLLEQPSGGEQNPSGGISAASREGERTSETGGGLGLSVGQVLSRLTGVALTLLDLLVNTVFVIFVGVFLAANPGLYRDGAVRLFPLDRREEVREVMNTLFRTLQGWLLGQFLSMLIVGMLTGLGLWLLGMPLVFTLAFLDFLLEFIPLIGPWRAGVPAVLIAFSQGPSQALWVALLYVAIQQLEGNLIYPLVQKRTVDLPPALTLLAVFVMGTLFGLVGLLAAVILVLVKRVYVKDALDEPSPRRGRSTSASTSRLRSSR